MQKDANTNALVCFLCPPLFCIRQATHSSMMLIEALVNAPDNHPP